MLVGFVTNTQAKRKSFYTTTEETFFGGRGIQGNKKKAI